MSANHSSNSSKRAWIFQANPKKYRILDSLREQPDEFWNLNQHANDIKKDDCVFIWLSGENAGIYAVGTVLSNPQHLPDSPDGMEYWNTKDLGEQAKPRVLVRYDRVFLDRPLLKQYLLCDPTLWNMEIIRFPRGTNFPVQATELKALEQWIAKSKHAHK